MNYATRILGDLDRRLNQTVELTLYGRAAFQLGFDLARLQEWGRAGAGLSTVRFDKFTSRAGRVDGLGPAG